MKVKIAPYYSKEFLETDRPQPLSDDFIESLIIDALDGNIEKDISNEVYNKFKLELISFISSSTLNNLTGLEKFTNIDICSGCTQFIDTIYMKGPVQTFEGDYRYHQRLNSDIEYTNVGNLKRNVPLIIAMPFPSTGAMHESMHLILDEAYAKQIPVHIDGAWITCCRNINFNFDHPAIESVAISLSKGLGLGWNRVGLRWSKNTNDDAISVMNKFNMNLKIPVIIGRHFMKNLKSDYLWNTHESSYYKICKDFNLTPTNSIYLAMNNGQPTGVSPLIRYLAQ